MKYFFRITLAGVLVYGVTNLLVPYYNFHIEHIENFLSGSLKISWILSPIIIRLVLGLFFVLASLLIISLIRVKWLKYFAPIFITIPFILNPVYPSNFQKISVHIEKKVPQGVILDSREKYILAFFSSNCIFCLEGAKRLKAAQKKSKNFPKVHVAAVSTEIENFFKTADVSFNYTIIGKDLFLEYTEGSYPKYFLVENNKLTILFSPQSLNYNALNSLSK